MKKILVFVGRPGAGKSFLINKFLDKYPYFESVDVFHYIKLIKEKMGNVPEELTIGAYEQMYQDFNFMEKDIILELGTNHPEFNLKKLAGLTRSHQVTLLLCLLDIEVCRNRCLARGQNDSALIFVGQSLEIRLNRIFPDLHKKFADSFNLKYHEIEMSLPIKERLDLIDGILCN